MPKTLTVKFDTAITALLASRKAQNKKTPKSRRIALGLLLADLRALAAMPLTESLPLIDRLLDNEADPLEFLPISVFFAAGAAKAELSEVDRLVTVAEFADTAQQGDGLAEFEAFFNDLVGVEEKDDDDDEDAAAEEDPDDEDEEDEEDEDETPPRAQQADPDDEDDEDETDDADDEDEDDESVGSSLSGAADDDDDEEEEDEDEDDEDEDDEDDEPPPPPTRKSKAVVKTTPAKSTAKPIPVTKVPPVTANGRTPKGSQALVGKYIRYKPDDTTALVFGKVVRVDGETASFTDARGNPWSGVKASRLTEVDQADFDAAKKGKKVAAAVEEVDVKADLTAELKIPAKKLRKVQKWIANGKPLDIAGAGEAVEGYSFEVLLADGHTIRAALVNADKKRPPCIDLFAVKPQGGLAAQHEPITTAEFLGVYTMKVGKKRVAVRITEG